MEAGIEQGPRLHLLGTWLEQRRRSLGFASFPGAGSFVQICMFLSQTTALCSVTLSLLSPPMVFSCSLCIFPSRLRTRKRHFRQGCWLQKKLTPTRRMSFKLLKRWVVRVALSGFCINLGRDFTFISSFPEWPATVGCFFTLLSVPFHRLSWDSP